MPAEIVLAKKRSLLRATSLVSLMTVISRIMGFARDMLLASIFGAQAGMDAFYVAFRIPNFMRRLFAEGAFSQAFVPVLAEYQKTTTDAGVKAFISKIAGSLSAVLTLVTFIGILAAPAIVFIFAPGFGHDAARATLATEMLRWTFPYLMLISLTAMAGAVLNTYGYFGVPAITPVFLNVCMILAALFISPYMNHPPMGLAYGVLIAGFVQFLFQIPFLYKRNLLVRPLMDWRDPGVIKVLKLIGPALFGVSIAQINLMIDTIFASFLQVGSVTWLYYTDRLTDFPLGVFGVAIATVILPHLSRRHAEQSIAHFSKALDWGLRLMLLLGIPAGLGLALFSMPMIAGSFGYGKFSVIDLLQTQKSLITLSLGIPAFMSVKILASAFYARQDIKTPVKVGAIAMGVNTLLCAIFIWPLAHAGLTLASSLASYLNCGLLLWLLIKEKAYIPSPGWLKFAGQLLFANIILSVYLWIASGNVQDWMSLQITARLSLLLAYVLVAILLYMGALRLVGIQVGHFRDHLKG